MFADLILIPAIRKDKETEFRRWFHWSSGYAKQLGFPERCLLKERGGQGYAVLQEHDSYDRLLIMLNNPFGQITRRRVAPLLEGEAVPRTYYTMLNRGDKGRSRFVILVSFPPVREEKDVEFRQWFWRSGACCANLPGVHRRRLLWPLEGGTYTAVMEYDGQGDLPDAQAGGAPCQAQEWTCPLLEEDPQPRFFERLSS